MWDITSIIFGANTVLFGFVLSAAHDQHALPLIVSAIIGISLTGFAARVCQVAQVTKTVGYGLCREIEKDFEATDAKYRLHTMIDDRYPKGMARHWVYAICTIFGIIWISVFLFGWCLACHAHFGITRSIV